MLRCTTEIQKPIWTLKGNGEFCFNYLPAFVHASVMQVGSGEKDGYFKWGNDGEFHQGNVRTFICLWVQSQVFRRVSYLDISPPDLVRTERPVLDTGGSWPSMGGTRYWPSMVKPEAQDTGPGHCLRGLWFSQWTGLFFSPSLLFSLSLLSSPALYFQPLNSSSPAVMMMTTCSFRVVICVITKCLFGSVQSCRLQHKATLTIGIKHLLAASYFTCCTKAV